MEPFLGQILLVPYNFAPEGWAFCDGRILPIQQHTALFSLIGTTYGGNGTTTFALPDLRGRVPVHVGASQGRGVSRYDLGETGGEEQVVLEPKQIGAQLKPTKALPDAHDLILLSVSKTPPEAVNLRQPYIGLNFIIALRGLYPSRQL